MSMTIESIETARLGWDTTTYVKVVAYIDVDSKYELHESILIQAIKNEPEMLKLITTESAGENRVKLIIPLTII